MNKHLIHIDTLISLAQGYYGLEKSEIAMLAEEIIRLRHVVAHFAPFMGQIAEEAINYARKLEESGVDPCEPALIELNETINRLCVAFKV